MHSITKEVKTAGVVVEKLEIELFDTIDELLQAVKPEEIVSYYNAQLVENKRNIARAKHQPDKASKEKRLKLAFAVAFTNFQPELADAIATGKQDEFLSSPQVQELVEKELTKAVAQ